MAAAVDHQSLAQRLLGALVYAPAGLALTVVDQLPGLASQGRDRLSGQVSSARAVGEFAVRTGRQELRRRSRDLLNPPATTDPASEVGPTSMPDRTSVDSTEVPPAGMVPETAPPTVAGEHLPSMSSLAIPGFDTLSASQVVPRLDGLSREELRAVRTYEVGSRGRRTVLNRVDQLLAERD
jgi:hypothetical protein